VCTLQLMPRVRISAASSSARSSCWLLLHTLMAVV
jgi:hypothetical protein